MDADFSLDMTLKGEPMQIWHMIVAFDEYVTGNASIYFSDCTMSAKSHRMDWNEFDDEDEDSLKSFAQMLVDGEIVIDGLGPFGSYMSLSDCIDIFKKVAECEPTAFFEASISGQTTYTEESLDCTLENGILHAESSYYCYDNEGEGLIDAFSLEQFVSMFKLNVDELDEDDLSDLYSYLCSNFDTSIREWGVVFYDDFLDWIEEYDVETAIDESEFKKVLNENNFKEVCSQKDTSEYWYDPVNKKYLDKQPQKFGMIEDVNEIIAKGLREKGLSDNPEAIGNLSIENAYEMFFAGEEAEDKNEDE